MTIIDAAGLTVGQAVVVGATGVVRNVSALAQGSSDTTASVGRSQIVTGHTVGTSLLEVDLTTPVAGVASGTSTTTGQALKVISVAGWAIGFGDLLLVGVPLPIHGTSSMVGEPVVEHQLPAVRAIVSPPKQFRYGQLLQRGDLPIYLCNQTGPVVPVLVRYTLYQVLPSGTRRQAGPARRVPVAGETGEFYVAGKAGELGQPGSWVVVWEWWYNLNSVAQSKEMEFEVLDAALANCPRDVTVRCRKYGWN